MPPARRAPHGPKNCGVPCPLAVVARLTLPRWSPCGPVVVFVSLSDCSHHFTKTIPPLRSNHAPQPVFERISDRIVEISVTFAIGTSKRFIVKKKYLASFLSFE